MYGRLTLRNSGGGIMKKSSLYFIYALLFVIIANVAEKLIVTAIATVGVLIFTFGAIVMYYIEDKDRK
jgi:hypothetical protein